MCVSSGSDRFEGVGDGRSCLRQTSTRPGAIRIFLSGYGARKRSWPYGDSQQVVNGHGYAGLGRVEADAQPHSVQNNSKNDISN